MGLKQVGIELVARGEGAFLAAISASEKAIARFGNAGEEVSRDLGKMGRSAGLAAASTEVLDKATGAAGRAADNLADQLADVNRELGQTSRGAIVAAGSLAAFSAASGAGALSKTAGSLGAVTNGLLGVGTASATAAGKLALVGTVVGGIGVAGFAAGAGAVAASILAVQAAAVTGAGAVLAFGVAFNALDEAAPIKKDLDETTKALENMKEKGINSGWEFDQLNTKLKGLQAEYDATFMGMVGTIAKFGKEASKEISKPIFDGLKVGLSGVVKLIQSPAVQNAVPRLAGIVEKAVASMTASFRKVIPAINWDTAINTRLDNLAKRVEDFTAAFDRALPKLLAWGGALKTLGGALGGPVMIGMRLFAKGLSDIDATGADFQAGIGRVANVMEFLGRIMAASSTIVSNLVGGLVTGLGPTLERLDKAFEGVIGGAGGFDKVLANIGEVVGRIGVSLGGFIGSLIELGVTVVDLLGKIGFFDAVVIVFDRARDAVLTFASALRGDWIDAGSEKIAFLDRVFGILGLTIRDLATAFGNFFSGNFDAGFDALGSAVGRVAGFILEAIPNIIAGLGKVLASIIQYVISKAPEILAQLETWATQFWAWIEPKIPTIIAEIGKISAAVIGWIAKAALDIAGKIPEWAGAFLGWVAKDVVPKLPDALKAIWDGLSSWIGSIAGQIGEAMKPWTNAIVKEVEGWAAAVGLPLDQWRAKFQGSLAAIGEFFTGPTMDDWKGRFQGSLTAIGEAITPVLDDWKGRFQGSLQAIGENFTPTLNDWKTRFQGSLREIGEFWDGLGRTIDEWKGRFQGSLNTIGGWIEEAKGRFQGSLNAIGGFFTSLADGIKKAVDEVVKVWDGLVQTIKNTGAAISAAAGGDFQKAYKLLTEGADTFDKAVSGSFADVVETWDSAADQVSDKSTVMTDGFMDASDRTKVSMGNIQKNVEGGVAGIGQALTKFTTAPFATEINKMPGQAGAAVDNTKSKISGADFTSVLLTAGSQVVDGLVNGILNNAGRARAAAASLGASVAGGAGQALQIASPSKLFEWIGKMLPAGLAKGIDENSDLAINAAMGMADNVGDAALKSIGDQADLLKKVSESVSSMLGTLDKLKGFTSPAIDAVTAFARSTRQVVDIFIEASKDYTEKSLKAANEYLETTGKVASTVSSMADALGKLRDWKGPLTESIEGFTYNVAMLVADFVLASLEFTSKMLAGATSFATTAGTVAEATGKMADSLSKLRNWKGPLTASIEGFVYNSKVLIANYFNASLEFTSEMLTASGNFSDTASKVADSTGKMADSLQKLQGWKGIINASVEGFVYNAKVLMLNYFIASREFNDKMLEAVNSFSDTAGKVADTTGKMAESLQKLNNWKGVLTSSIEGFVFNAKVLMANFYNASTEFSETMLPAIGLFSDTLAKVGAGASAAFGILKELPKYVSPGETGITTFANDSGTLARTYYAIAKTFDDEMLKVTSAFAETLGKVSSGASGAFSLLTNLKDYVGIGAGAIDAFGTDTSLLTSRMAAIASTFSTEALTAISAFGEATGKLFAGLKDAMVIFEGLHQYTGTPSKVLTAFVNDVELTVILAGQMAQRAGTELLGQVQAFGAATGALFAGLKNAMDVFKGMRDKEFEKQPSITMQAFIDQIIYTVSLAADMAQRTDKELLGQATAFATAVDKIFSKLKSALDIFKSLEGLKDNPAGALGKVLEGIGAAIEKMAQLNSQAATYLSGAETFASTMQRANQLIAGSVGGMSVPDAGAGAGAGGTPASSPDLPGMADGGTARKPGLFKVGEEGPEIVWLPKGASVIDAMASARIMDSLANSFGPMVAPPASASQIYNQQTFNQQQASQVIYDQRQSHFNQTNHTMTPDAAQDYYIWQTLAGK